MRTSILIVGLSALGLAACSGCDDEGLITDSTSGDVGSNDSGGVLDGGDSGPIAPDATQTDMGGEDMAMICAPSDECGEECCTEDELCIGSVCVVPGDACQHSVDCGDGSICEPTIQQCIPAPDFECTYVPDFDEFEPVIDHAWSESTEEPDFNQVMMTPAVIDLDEDGIPEIIFSTFQGSDYNGPSVLRAINGRTYDSVFDLTEPEKRVQGSASVAIGDIDLDGRNEIVAVRPTQGPEVGGLIAFDDHTTGWAVKWSTDRFNLNWDGAALVDLDGSGSVEIVAANRVFDGATGDELCVNAEVGAVANQSTTADLNGDGIHEIITGGGAFRFVRNADGSVECPTYWTFDGVGGFPAVGDFGTFASQQNSPGVLDGIPEVVTVNTTANEQVQLWNGQTGERVWGASMPVTDHPFYSVVECSERPGGGVRNGGGAPTIADFDGDGVPEVATAGTCYYAVFRADGSLHWRHPSRDFSSRVTGSSVFDFQGDGKAEVVYADECFLRVYDGSGNGDQTTDVLFRLAHSTGTTRELPVIADVNADFQANIVFASNDYASGLPAACAAGWPDHADLGGARRGISVVSDQFNRWVRTRPVWNQHAYHVTNVCDGVDDTLCDGPTNRAGAIPLPATPNWQRPGFNNFRQNVQGAGIFDAPDLVILSVEHRCDDDDIAFDVVVANQGARGVPAGIEIALWVTGASGVEEPVAVVTTPDAILPGGRTTLEVRWDDDIGRRGEESFSARLVVDSDHDGASQLNECDDTNNDATHTGTCGCTRDEDCRAFEFCRVSAGVCERVPG